MHPEDWPLVVQAVKEAEERTQKQPRLPDTHIAYRLKSLDSSLLQMTLPDTPSGVSECSASLFEEQSSEPEWASVPLWKLLSETEQQPWLEQARRELVAIHTGSGITPKPKLVEVRAKNLYEMSWKK